MKKTHLSSKMKKYKKTSTFFLSFHNFLKETDEWKKDFSVYQNLSPPALTWN